MAIGIYENPNWLLLNDLSNQQSKAQTQLTITEDEENLQIAATTGFLAFLAVKRYSITKIVRDYFSVNRLID